MGLQPVDGGEILFEGDPLPRDLKPYRRKVQMVFQDPTGTLNPRQTIYEIIAEGLRIHGIDRGPNGEPEEQLVAKALSRAGLRPPERFFLRYPHELSGGQRQRVVIAGALVLEPEVIVADEPVSNLDASVRGEILQLLMKLREDLGLTIIIVTHDLGLAWTVADRVAIMYLGRIVEIGPAEDVLLRPEHPLHEGPARRGARGGGLDRLILPGEPPDPTRIPEGCRFHPRCPVVESGRAAELSIESRCRTEDLVLRELAPETKAACYEAFLRHGSGAPHRLTPQTVSGPGAATPGVSTVSSPLSTPRIASISESETRASGGVLGVLRPNRGEHRAEVRLGHLGTGLELSDLLRQRARGSRPRRDLAAPRASPHEPSAARPAARRPPGPLDQAVDHGSPEVGVSSGARLRAPRRGGAWLASRAWAPSDGLLLVRLDWPCCRAGGRNPVRVRVACAR